MGQVSLFFLLIFAFIVGTFVYFSPRPRLPSPLKTGTVTRDDDAAQELDIRKFQRLNVTTDRGIVQIRRQVDDLTRQRRELMDMVDHDRQVLDDTIREISEMTRQVDGKSPADVMKLKALGLQIQSDQRLLVAHGLRLIALNDQLTKNRQLLAEERDWVNISANDQTDAFFERVKRQMDEARQKAREGRR